MKLIRNLVLVLAVFSLSVLFTTNTYAQKRIYVGSYVPSNSGTTVLYADPYAALPNWDGTLDSVKVVKVITGSGSDVADSLCNIAMAYSLPTATAESGGGYYVGTYATAGTDTISTIGTTSKAVVGSNITAYSVMGGELLAIQSIQSYANNATTGLVKVYLFCWYTVP